MLRPRGLLNLEAKLSGLSLDLGFMAFGLSLIEISLLASMALINIQK